MKILIYAEKAQPIEEEMITWLCTKAEWKKSFKVQLHLSTRNRRTLAKFENFEIMSLHELKGYQPDGVVCLGQPNGRTLRRMNLARSTPVIWFIDKEIDMLTVGAFVPPLFIKKYLWINNYLCSPTSATKRERSQNIAHLISSALLRIEWEPKIGSGDPKTVMYLINPTDDSLYTAIRLIEHINGSERHLVIAGKQFQLERLSTICNANIKLVPIENRKLPTPDLLITSGHFAIDGLNLRIPVIVWGEYGYGGIVTSENLKYMYEDDFRGRNGGSRHEAFPIKLFEGDLNLTLSDHYHSLDPTTEHVELFNNIIHGPQSLTQVITTTFENHIEQSIAQREGSPKLKLSNDILLNHGNDHTTVIRVSTRKDICQIGVEARGILISLLNHETLKQVAIKYNYSEKDLSEFIDDLMYEQILV